jgi:hypothetical protein
VPQIFQVVDKSPSIGRLSMVYEQKRMISMIKISAQSLISSNSKDLSVE